MARQIRKKSGTGIYHVMLRGINRQDIFEDDLINRTDPMIPMLPKPYALPAGATSRKAFRSHFQVLSSPLSDYSFFLEILFIIEDVVT